MLFSWKIWPLYSVVAWLELPWAFRSIFNRPFRMRSVHWWSAAFLAVWLHSSSIPTRGHWLAGRFIQTKSKRSIMIWRMIEWFGKDAALWSIAKMERFRSFRALYDIKATDMGSQSVMFKAEVDMDGREITRSYLERIDIQLILQVRRCRGAMWTMWRSFVCRKSERSRRSKQQKHFYWNMVKTSSTESVPKSIESKEIFV